MLAGKVKCACIGIYQNRHIYLWHLFTKLFARFEVVRNLVSPKNKYFKTPQTYRTKIHNKTHLSLQKLCSESERNYTYGIIFLLLLNFISRNLVCSFYLTWCYKAHKFSKIHMLSYLSFEMSCFHTMQENQHAQQGNFKNCYLQLWEPPGHTERQLYQKEQEWVERNLIG